MSFYKKYELQRLAHEGEAKVFRAIQTATGSQVYLHVFPVNNTTRDLASEVQRRLAAGPAADLLETGEFAGAIYVVTPPVDGMLDLRAYLHSHAPGAAAPPPPPAPPTAPAPPVWTAPPPPMAPAFPPAPPAPPAQFAPPPPPHQYTPPPAAPAPPVQFAPSPPPHFTPPPPHQFAPPPPATTPPAQFAPPPPPPQFAPPPPQASPPFIPPAQPPRSAVQQHPTAHGQDAVTQPVEPRRRRRTTEIISHGTVTVGHGPAEPSTSGPGEFTRMFSDPPAAQQPGAVLPPAPPQPPAAFPPTPPSFSPPPTPPIPVAPPPAHAPASAGPGEFTRLFSGPPQPSASSSYTGAPLPPPAPHTASPYSPPPPPPQQAAPPPRDREMADFERIFGPAGGRPFPADEPPPQEPVSHNPLPSWPQAPSPPPPSQQGYQQPPVSQHGSGEFTRFFGNNFSGDPIDVEREQQRAAAEPSAPPRRPFQKASEFTQMFGPGAMDPGAPPPPPPPRSTANWADQSGAYTMFDSQLNTPPPTTRRRVEMTQQAGPSEYTRMIGGGGAGVPGAGLNQDSSALKSGAMPAANPKQVPGQQMSAAPSKAGQIGIFIAIGGILIALIVALVLLLTSK